MHMSSLVHKIKEESRSCHVFHVLMFFSSFYVLLTVCVVVFFFIDILLICSAV